MRTREQKHCVLHSCTLNHRPPSPSPFVHRTIHTPFFHFFLLLLRQIQKLNIEGNMALWLQLQRVIRNGSVNLISTLPHSSSYCSSRSFSKSTPYIVKVGIPEFLNGIGKGVESHVAKLDSEIGDFQKLLVTRTLKLKKLGIPCKHRKLILKHAHKYRLGLWRPRAEPIKA
ncbi:hypothetical protein P8452_12107 [Trifolium repens]|nr:hypothetical protein P8452_12107 [Trifolium repens]